MASRRHRGLAGLAVLLAAVPTAATAAAPARVIELDERAASDGTMLAVAAERRPTPGGRARFRFTVAPPSAGERIVSEPVLEIAGRRRLAMGTAVDCSAAGATAVYGTVLRGARRVVVRFAGGRTVRLRRRRPPPRWELDGWVLGRVLQRDRTVRAVVAFDRLRRPDRPRAVPRRRPLPGRLTVRPRSPRARRRSRPGSPSATRSSVTVPAAGATISCSIFIASSTSSGWRGLDRRRPAATRTRSTVPGIGRDQRAGARAVGAGR